MKIYEPSHTTKYAGRLALWIAVSSVFSYAFANGFVKEVIEESIYLDSAYWEVSRLLFLYTCWLYFFLGISLICWKGYKYRVVVLELENKLNAMGERVINKGIPLKIPDADPSTYLDLGTSSGYEDGHAPRDIDRLELDIYQPDPEMRRGKKIGYTAKARKMTEHEKLAKAYAAGMKAAYKNFR